MPAGPRKSRGTKNAAEAGARRDGDRARMRRLGDPTVSVVITNHNYGHFLASCIESVLRQTRPPEEIIVVDDGSTDGSRRVLEGYGGAIEVIATENLGQAAAFNTGFAASSGDLVLFLDADDALKPECLETVLIHWHDDLAVLTFGLEEVDEAGRSLGIHRASVEASCGDNRPALLGTGTFAFPPTSGNVFSRSTLLSALPMPEERWRISADCFLIRAAALLGRAEALGRVLGEYRLHGANNYAKSVRGLRDTSVRRSNLRDIADALDDLARAKGLLPDEPDEARGQVAALAARAAAIRAQIGDGDWPGEVPDCAAVMRSRWPFHLTFGETFDFREPGEHRMAVVPGWDDVGFAAISEPKTLRFSADPARDPLLVTVRLGETGEPAGPWYGEVHFEGEVIWSGFASGGDTIVFAVPKAPWEARRVVELALVSGGGLWFRTIRVEPASRMGSAPRLVPGQRARLSVGDWAGLAPEHWAETESGVGLAAPTGGLAFTADLGAGAEIVLETGSATPRGHLRVEMSGRPLLEATVSGRRDLVVSLPPGGEAGERPRSLGLAFLPDDARAGQLELTHIGLRDAAGHPAPPLNPGETVSFGASPHARAFLAGGWTLDPGEGARNDGPEAEIAFHAPGGADAGRLELLVRPLFPPMPGTRHVLGFSLGGEIVSVVDLEGTGACQVDIPPIAPGGVVSLGVHSILVSADAESAEPSMAPLELIQMRFDAAQAEPLGGPPPRRPPGQPEIDRLLEEADEALAAPDGETDIARLVALREELLRNIAECSEGALLVVAARRRGVEVLARLGARLAGRAPGVRPPAARDDGSEAERLRSALRDMLTVPAYRSGGFVDPSRLPAPLYWCPEAVEAHIATPPVLATPDDQAAYSDWLGRLYGHLDAAIARAPEGSAAFRMCAGVLERLRAVRVIFADGCLAPLLRPRSRAIERLLARRGARLAWSPALRPERARLRVGVLVRDVLPNPEGWALLGMWAGIDRDAIEPILFTMVRGDETLDTGDRFERTVPLSGLSVDAAVAEIRACDLDVFITGCYAFDFERVSSILAHKLARVQVWHGAVCPSTGAFRSFDVALTNRATEPEDPQRHYTETLAWIEGPAQCAYDFGKAAPAGLPEMRRELGLPENAVLAVSGAMAHKITDPLLDAWAAILAGVPEAVLVLYPFAPNWSMTFEADAFLDRVERALSRHGVGEERVRVLPTQTPDRVGRLVASADLYLDSFPYSGATTVCEALSRGTPVIALAGDALRQLTGTSWVRAYGEDGFVAGSPEDYVTRAIGILKDKGALEDARRRLTGRNASGEPPHCAVSSFGKRFSEALLALRETGGSETPKSRKRGEASKRAGRRASLPPIRKFGILTAPRTGSTLLCNLLNLTPGVLCHFELFHADMIQYRHETVKDAAEIAKRDADPVGFLRAVFDEARESARMAVGFKHFGHLSGAVSEELISDRDVRIVRLIRSNLLAQYSSERLAKESNKWVSLKGEEQKHAETTFDPEDFERWESYHHRVDRLWMEMLAGAGRDVLMIEYDTIRDPATVDRLSDFLGLRLVKSDRFDIQRQNTESIIERFANPEVVRKYLEGRRLEHWAHGG